MSHSLRAKLSGLRYKGIITDKDYQRLCKALDTEKAIEDIKAEIRSKSDNGSDYAYIWICDAIEIIDKHISGKEKE